MKSLPQSMVRVFGTLTQRPFHLTILPDVLRIELKKSEEPMSWQSSAGTAGTTQRTEGFLLGITSICVTICTGGGRAHPIPPPAQGWLRLSAPRGFRGQLPDPN